MNINMNRKIYDCFTFFNELDILEMRLNILDSVVDYFVLIEGNKFMSGSPKNSLYLENKERYAKFSKKIIHKIVDLPEQFSQLQFISNAITHEEKSMNLIYSFMLKTNLFNRFTEPRFGRSFYIKESPRFCMNQCNDNDIIILSDCDEFPNPEILGRLNEFFEDTEFYTFNQTCYYYYLNVLRESHLNNVHHNYPGSETYTGKKTSNWKGSRMGSYGKIKDYSFNELRAQPNNDIMDGGWHFSYMGGSNAIKEKLSSGDTEKYDSEVFLNNIENNLKNLSDVILNNDKLTKININENYPDYIRNNSDKYKHMIL